RYVQEWLGIMCTGQIVELHGNRPEETTYYLPPEHAALLIRKSGSGNMGVYTQEIPLLTQTAMARVAEDFSKGEGIPYEVYPGFQAFMAQLSHAKHRQVLVRHFLPGVDDGRLMARLEKGIRVCDMGCGQGIALHLMAEKFPASSFTGIDNDEPAIAKARSQASELGLENSTFLVKDAAAIYGDPDFFQAYDYITAFDAIHDQSRPLEALKAVRHMLAPDGMFSMIDIDAASHPAGNLDHPMGPFLYTAADNSPIRGDDRNGVRPLRVILELVPARDSGCACQCVRPLFYKVFTSVIFS
ncbi:MAG: methyltransferase domain-containing protein, partial [Desulfobacteraceae bacterium]|nr:methyltransferase domain-containing protein [Desulfobacteraceae bacterium]